MESRIAARVHLHHQPVALLWSDEKPEGAKQFQEGRWGCILWLATGAAKGNPAVCDIRTFGCIGGGVGMGFGEQYKYFRGGEEGFCRFLSSGNDATEEGRLAAERARPFMRAEAYDDFLHGERYLKSPEETRSFLDALPMRMIPTRYVVFKPLSLVDRDRETPKTILFFADPDQLSALVILANYGRGSNDNVIMPYAAGCQNIGIYPYREAEAEKPRAVVGLTDLSARVFVRQQLGPNYLTFAVPFSMFEEMEGNVEGSFLERETWRALTESSPK